MTLFKLAHDQLLPTLEEPLQEVSLEDWRENAHAHTEATALVIANDQSIMDIASDISGFGVIILEFPAFTDGRAYGQARLLRDRIGYRGEIRARGNVLRDQVFFMTRCGFNGFEVEDSSVDELNAAINEFSHAYQSAADGREPVWRKRTARVAAA